MQHFQSFSYTFCYMHVYKGRTEYNLLIQDAQNLVGRMWRENNHSRGFVGLSGFKQDQCAVSG